MVKERILIILQS